MSVFEVFLVRIQSEYGKIRTRKTPTTVHFSRSVKHIIWCLLPYWFWRRFFMASFTAFNLLYYNKYLWGYNTKISIYLSLQIYEKITPTASVSLTIWFSSLEYENNILKIKTTRNAENRLNKLKNVSDVHNFVTASNMMILFTFNLLTLTTSSFRISARF